MGDAYGLDRFGVNLVTLPPGSWSSQRHWHTNEDEFVYVLSGCPTLITDDARETLHPGMCAGFRAGSSNGHHLVNETEDTITYLEVGNRDLDDDVYYSDIDMQTLARNRGGRFTHRDGSGFE